MTLVTLADASPAEPPLELKRLCRSIEVLPRRQYHPGSGRALAGFLSLTPRSLAETRSREMAATVWRQSQQQDAIIASQWATACYHDCFGGRPSLFEELELGSFQSAVDRATERIGRWRHRLTLLKLSRYTRRLLSRYSACTVVSEAERALLRRHAPSYGHVHIVPNCVDLGAYSRIEREPRKASLVFTGSFRYSANYDAMRWFLASVYPSIRARVPDVCLTITGDHAGLPLPPADGVRLAGYVQDVRPLLASSSVSIVPLRGGGGTRLKILEAMALQVPVVSTSKGAEGLEVGNGRHLLLADTPDDFAAAVVSVLRDSQLRASLVENAHRLVSDRYDWPKVLPSFVGLVERVAAARGPEGGTNLGDSRSEG